MARISALTVFFLLVGLACVAVALVYLTTKTTDLPSFFPGHVAHTAHAAKYTKRGVLGVAAAGVFFVIALLALHHD